MPSLKFPDRTVQVGERPFIIGRSPDADLVLPEPSISRRHARIDCVGGKYYLEDLNSGAGTRINKRPILKEELKDHDQVAIGPFVFQFLDPRHPEPAGPAADEAVFLLKKEFHQELIDRIDLKKIPNEERQDQMLRDKIELVLSGIIGSNLSRLPPGADPDQLRTELMDEILGLGPIEPFLRESRVSEIMVNGAGQIYIEMEGKLLLTGRRFMNDEQVKRAIERIVHPVGRRIDESSPMVDARLRDGSRVNAVIPPLSLNGPLITIRKFPPARIRIDNLIEMNSLDRRIAEFLEFAVANRITILISGGTGSGKTTLLNVLSRFVPEGERIITIEDAAELDLEQPHVISLESRPANIEGKGLVTIRDLVRNALRMRPDRIVIGECRGGEAFDMLSAMNTGHDGSLSTIHANSPRDALSRLETLVLMAGMELPSKAIRQQIASAIRLVVQQSRLPDGSRKVTEVVEVTGMEGDTLLLQEIYRFKKGGAGTKGEINGRFAASGLIPAFCLRLRDEGRDFPARWFEPGREK